MKKGCEVKSSSSLASRSRSLICPLCEAGKLQPSGQDSARCASCAGPVSGAMLGALRQIVALPDALGKHACEECGHPEMRLLPDGTFHCPSCGSEVLPFGAPVVEWEISERTEAYWCGWIDGRSEEHTSELQSRQYLVCRLLLEKKNNLLLLTSSSFTILLLPLCSIGSSDTLPQTHPYSTSTPTPVIFPRPLLVATPSHLITSIT